MMIPASLTIPPYLLSVIYRWQLSCFVNRMVRIVLSVLFLFIMAGCGKKEFPDYSGTDFIFYEEADGLYDVDFVYLNARQVRRFRVNSTMWIKGNQMYVSVNMESAPSKIRFQQFIHKGVRCPDSRDDQNGDRMIDISEVMEASGEILIPLDSTIQEQLKGQEWFPITNKNGKYFYSRSASVSKLMEDLYKKDEIPGDGMGKLLMNESLSLERRVIVIYGNKTNPLLPVACGVLKPKYL